MTRAARWLLSVLVALLAPALAAAPPKPGLDRAALSADLAAIASAAKPGRLGVAVEDVASGDRVFLAADQSFPMQSVFKAPLGAAVLAAVDAKKLDLDEIVELKPRDLSVPYSPIAAAFRDRTKYSLRELLVAASGGSDNTAADVLMERIGGPAALTAFLRERGVHGINVDRYERQFQPQIAGLPAFRPEWITPDGFDAAAKTVPLETRQRAMKEYLGGQRDSLTPRGALAFLRALHEGDLVSPESTKILLDIMTKTTTAQHRIIAGLPADATLAHKSGTARFDLGMSPAVNDIGIITLGDGRVVMLAVLLSESTATEEERDRVHADVARAVLKSLR